MAGVQALGGALNVTLNDATSKGAYMPDGSLRVTDTPGQGICDASGALRIASNVANGVYSPRLDSIRYSDGASDAATGVQFKDGAIRMVSGQDPATTAWVAAVVANGGAVSNARKVLVNNLIVGLKADGIWTKLDRLWVRAAENAASALTDLVADSLATAVNAPTFTVDVGYTGASTKYLNSNFSAGTAPSPKFVQDSASIFAWNNTTGITTPIIGEQSQHTLIYPAFSGINIAAVINDSTAAGINVAGGNVTGLFAGNRNAANAQQCYVNGALAGSNANASTAPSAFNFLSLTADAATFYVNGQLCADGFGGSLTGTEHLNLYTRLRTYMTAVGVP